MTRKDLNSIESSLLFWTFQFSSLYWVYSVFAGLLKFVDVTNTRKVLSDLMIVVKSQRRALFRYF